MAQAPFDNWQKKNQKNPVNMNFKKKSYWQL
jgi:hypothetical protein